MKISRDQDSFQARIEGDDFFFLRRLVDPDDRLTDLNFGALSLERQASALHHFMIHTGGWPVNRVEFDFIGFGTDDAAELDKKATRIKYLINQSIPWTEIDLVERITVGRHVRLRMRLK